MNIAVLGFGTIGSGVCEIIKQHETTDIHTLSVTKILDLPQNKHLDSRITSDIQDILDDVSISCVVETMGGIHPAYEFIVASLKQGKHVVTANKAVVAKYLEEFEDLASTHNVKFRFEASVGGGIPWIASLYKAMRVDSIHHFYGIFNGTSNYILDNMKQHGSEFKDVLKKAQDLGYAEADPSADVDGYDVLNKTIISSALAFNSKPKKADIPVFSMRTIQKQDIEYFESKHQTIKYIGEATLSSGSYEAFVMPSAFKNTDLEANVASNFNIITLYGKTIGPLKFFGQGAGKLPTANAIVQDILDLQDEQIQYTLHNLSNLPYESKQQHQFVFRTNKKIANENIQSIEAYYDVYYHYTKAITADVLSGLLASINDQDMFIVKIMDLGDIND